jgi:putative addiction module component (TIGR02574 family)
MGISTEVLNQVFSLAANERFELAQQLLDSIDESTAAQLDEQFIAELNRRHNEMIRGDEIVGDWRVSLSEIENSISMESQD